MSKTDIVRRKTRVISVGDVSVGGDNPVRVQSMTDTDTRDAISTSEQIIGLERLGCEIIRVAVPDAQAAEAIKEILPRITIPLIADIHFDHKLAIQSLENGAACVRINPGNIGAKKKTLEIIRCAKELNKSIRIGVNAGSLEKDLLKKYGVCAESLVKSALKHVEVLEENDFFNYKVSIKASNVPMTVAAYELFSAGADAPLHIGVTEAGTKWMGTVKSAVGIGGLLLRGIGDTLRVSLTAHPEEEIKAAWAILQASGARRRGVEIISCPTCGRTEIDMISLAEKVGKACEEIGVAITVAVMGCAVNGPGEAREADYGIAGGKGEGLIFAKGEIIKKVPEDKLLSELINIIRSKETVI